MVKIKIFYSEKINQAFHTTLSLYNTDIFEELPKDIYAIFLPVNGVGDNMNMVDAARFAKRVGAEKVVPLHTGMFDNLDPNDLDCDNKVIPEIYKEIDL